MVVKVQWTFDRAKECLAWGCTLRTDGQENLLETGAKLKYIGGGWWYLCGYAHDGRDVTPYL